MKKNSAIYGIVMAVSLLAMLIIPLMPYLHMEILQSYLGKSTVNAVDLVKEMYVLHGMPGSTNVFGHEYYELITLVLMILGILLIALPVVFGLISMILVLKGGYRARKAGCTLAVLIFLIFAGCLAVFTFAGRFVTITMSAGYGVYYGLAASVLFLLAAFGCRREAAGRRAAKNTKAKARTKSKAKAKTKTKVHIQDREFSEEYARRARRQEERRARETRGQ